MDEDMTATSEELKALYDFGTECYIRGMKKGAQSVTLGMCLGALVISAGILIIQNINEKKSKKY